MYDYTSFWKNTKWKATLHRKSNNIIQFFRNNAKKLPERYYTINCCFTFILHKRLINFQQKDIALDRLPKRYEQSEIEISQTAQ